MYASIANTTTVNQPTATTSAAYPSTVAPSTVNQSTVNQSTICRPSRQNINVVHAKFGHNKLLKLFTSIAITSDFQQRRR